MFKLYTSLGAYTLWSLDSICPEQFNFSVTNVYVKFHKTKSGLANP